MPCYPSLVGKPVEVVYRLGFVNLLVNGILFADSGQFILLEQHLYEQGRVRTFYSKIPYPCIVRLSESNPGGTSPPT